MPSRAESIAARVAAALAGATDAGARVYRDRADAFSREESPAILVELVDEDTTLLGGGLGGRFGAQEESTLRLAVIVVVRGATWQTVADAVRCQAHALLVADATLQALMASWRRDRCEWKAASADQAFAYCAQIYAAKFLSRAHALDQPA